MRSCIYRKLGRVQMQNESRKKRIAILGGGPSGLFVYKRLVESGNKEIEIHIFERKKKLGIGMPYSEEGANREHITNVSDNEIPDMVTDIEKWIQTVPSRTLQKFDIDLKRFNEYKVVPRLLFGHYLSAQFDLLLAKAKKAGFDTKVHLESAVTDIIDQTTKKEVWIETEGNETFHFDHVVICTGHNWPKKHEGEVPGYYDSPYPPSKLQMELNHPVAIKGSSLTAIDAIRTLARNNGTFKEDSKGKLTFKPAKNCPDFKVVMHSKNGMLPAIRFHLEEAHISIDSTLSKREIESQKEKNDGFLSLDYVFEKAFKDKFLEKDPVFYKWIKDLCMEEFVESMMGQRERMEPFQLFRKEYAEAEKSIKEKESIHWKELLAVLSFAMNQPAKHFSAEDTLRLQKVLMPLISIVIAFVPQSSCKELFALNDAGKLDLVSVGSDSSIKPESKGGITYTYTDEEKREQSVYYQTFVDCVGQPHLSYKELPFPSLLAKKTICLARLAFKSAKEGEKTMKKEPEKVQKDPNGKYYLQVPGITINDNYQLVNGEGLANERLFIMAVPYIGGYNPDYSGLDFSEAASECIVNRIFGD